MSSIASANALLDALRRTPMLRGGQITREKSRLRIRISRAIERQGVLPRLAQRVALQLVWKFDIAELGKLALWSAVGQVLQQETDRLRTRVGLVDRQIIVALPKMSARQIEDLFDELRAADPTVARTILNVALDAAEPVPAARRYLVEYHRVVKELKTLDPEIARTVANATFMAHSPNKKAIDHLKTFSELATKFGDDVSFARTVAKVAFRASDPLKAARHFIADYDGVVADLASQGVESQIARSLASIASLGGDPIATGRRLRQNFERVVDLVKETHPWVARSIALSACRATDPVAAARAYMKNYDTIVRLIGKTDPHHAREVATQAFRSDNPLRWAKRYLSEIQMTRAASR